MNGRILILSVCAALAIAGCGDDDDSSTASSESGASATEAAERTKPKVEIPKGSAPKDLEIEDLIDGSGPASAAAAGDLVTVQYVGVDYETGKEFDASWDRGQPFSFQLGAGQVIPGWDQGVEGMKVGGQRELVIPSRLAYGRQGQPPAIGPDATLVFVIDLLEVQ